VTEASKEVKLTIGQTVEDVEEQLPQWKQWVFEMRPLLAINI
jgi:hypothetical protein